MDARRVAVVGVVLVASALSACTGNGTPPGRDGSSAPVSSEATAAGASASASVGPSASSPPPTARPNTPPPSPSRPAGFTTAAKRGGAAPSPASLLRLIRAGRHAGYERVVFEFAGPPPAYLVSYVSGVREDPSDRPVPLEGDAFLLVVMHGATLDTTPQVTDPTKARSPSAMMTLAWT